MNRILRGLHFQTVGGTDYYYDDCSGLCFPCPAGLREAILNMSSEGIRNPAEEDGPTRWGNFALERHRRYGAFFDDARFSNKLGRPNPAEIANTIQSEGFFQLLLVVTSHCNMRCRYCVYSDNYPYCENLSTDFMPSDVAIAALDYYFDNIRRIRQRDPARAAAITFYGGEPLLNFPLIKDVVNYARKIKMDNILYNISTNGTLLSDSVVDFLVQHNFGVSVSLDGPREQHDLNRVAPDGKGTFDRIFANIERFWERYPGYERLNFLVAYDWTADMRELRRFFGSRDQFKKSLFLFSQISPFFTDYYRRFSRETEKNFHNAIDELKLNMRTQVCKDDPIMKYFLLAPHFLYLMRRIISPPGHPAIPATSTCLPGHKICVLPDGRIQPCERVPGLADIGSVNSGLDYEAIADLIYDYNEKITSGCKGCPIIRLCGTCFSHFWSGNDLRKPTPSFCEDQIAWKKTLLIETYSLLEENPNFYKNTVGIDFTKYCDFSSLQA